MKLDTSRTPYQVSLVVCAVILSVVIYEVEELISVNYCYNLVLVSSTSTLKTSKSKQTNKDSIFLRFLSVFNLV